MPYLTLVGAKLTLRTTATTICPGCITPPQNQSALTEDLPGDPEFYRIKGSERITASVQMFR